MATLTVRNLSVTYTISGSKEEKRALRNASFTLEEGQILALLGPSGSGKSSLLRALTGLEESQSSEITYKGIDLRCLPPNERKIGMVFQDGQLFPNYTVKGNIEYGLANQELSKSEKEDIVKNLLELVDLQGFEDRNIETLSGGQAQRVALARALAPKPRILLLDEPLSALDKSLREQLSSELRQILKKTNTTAIYVTHDQDEAFAIADLVGYISDGNLQRIDTPEEIWRHPRTLELAKFLGYSPFLDYIGASYMGIFLHSNQYLAARPYAFSIARSDCARCQALMGNVKELRKNKDEIEALVKLDAGGDAWIKIPDNYKVSEGDLIALQVNKGQCTIVS
ncbi:ABC transporter ATP-binding protein [Actinomyces sp. zg-332]|uniref:ABC transporter ATP-binding protein n=1 Tax=Actinomyces sp. zg-332 TaxID=2708340 RepID=UPI00141F4210|nr:ABC transporter ATP-binding protein [Actinomyces sp. zg-332]QPK94220.1 ABC transporter ATP-binding protein [Actinomyces sp. zg-332]